LENMASPWPVKRRKASPWHDLDALEQERKSAQARAGRNKGECARVGVGKNERERARGRRGEHAGKRRARAWPTLLSRAASAPARARCFHPCLHAPLPPYSRAGSAPALSLALHPLLSRSHRPYSPTGKGGCLPPLCSRVIFALCQGEDAAPAHSCVCGCCLPPLPLPALVCSSSFVSVFFSNTVN
jgi:hypothetical protein